MLPITCQVLIRCCSRFQTVYPLSFSLGLYVEVLFCRFLVLQPLCPVDVLAVTNNEVMTFVMLLFFMGSLYVSPGT